MKQLAFRLISFWSRKSDDGRRRHIPLFSVNLLIVDSQFPMSDRASVDVRMSALVRLLLEEGNALTYFVTDVAVQEKAVGRENVAKYRAALEQLGVVVAERTGWEKLLVAARYDIIIFKYFFPAEHRISLIRIWQPWAKVVIDSVDLVYARLLAKAELSKNSQHYDIAAQTKRSELATYASADLVLTVTTDEKAQLAAELPNLPICVVPNIHEIPDTPRAETEQPSLLFVGAFTHEPNVDAVLFCWKEIWPHIVRAVPNVRWTIVGGKPTAAIQALSSENVQVTGHVPETLPYLLRSWVSIAPLRFGAGMKGKVGEAMASGTPVVTSSFGAQGFPLVPSTHLFVHDDPRAFAACVIELLETPSMRQRIGAAGRAFIEANYSPTVVRNQVRGFVSTTRSLPSKKLPLRALKRLLHVARLNFLRHVLWRFSI